MLAAWWRTSSTSTRWWWPHELGEVLQFELVPNFKAARARVSARRSRSCEAALAGVDGAAAAAALEAGGIDHRRPARRTRSSSDPDEVELRVQGQAGFAVSREGGEVVALDLTIDDDLRRRGLVREVVRLVQDLRKARGLEVSDRIVLHLSGLADIGPWLELVGREVLAESVEDGPGKAPVSLSGWRTILRHGPGSRRPGPPP